jgi:Fe-Mn family superoxide dismutase
MPYAFAALEPVHRYAQTMEIHYTKHHAAYVKNANEAIAAEGVKAADENDLSHGSGPSAPSCATTPAARGTTTSSGK